MGHRRVLVHGRALGLAGKLRGDVKKDGLLAADVSDGFVPAAGLGVTYRPTPSHELGAAWSSAAPIQAQGTGESELGPVAANIGGMITIHPSSTPRCAPGGTLDALKTCVSFQFPMMATVGGRYKLLDAGGAVKGDVELNVGWENWGKRCDFIKDPSCTSPGQYRVIVDGEPHLDGFPAPPFKDSINRAPPEGHVDHAQSGHYSIYSVTSTTPAIPCPPDPPWISQ